MAAEFSDDEKEKAGRISVLIADDHPVIIEGLTTALSRHGIEVAGQATTTGEVVARYEQLAPDVVVLDVRFREEATGLDVAAELLDRHPDAKIVFYSQFDQDDVIRDAYRAGGRGFVTKTKAPAVLADAIRQVQEGKTQFLPEIAERLALLGVRGDDSPRAKLDAREFQVFCMMAAGATNAEIAGAIGLSLKTISTTSQNIKDKLKVQRQADLTRLAVKHKLIDP